MIAQPKPKTFRSAKYLAWIRSKPCAICGSVQAVQAHHAQGGGMSIKSSDYTAIPACFRCHAHIHNSGRKDAIKGLPEIISRLRAEWESRG